MPAEIDSAMPETVPDTIPDTIRQASQSGRPVRLHTCAGEVLVAHVLDCDGAELRYTVVHSSQPERYAVCDSTGFCLRFEEVERARLLSKDQAERSGKRRRSRATTD